VDTGFASPEKQTNKNQNCPEYDARSSDGPGVSMSGESTPPTKSGGAPLARLRFAANLFAAVPL
jgi:hypothetical protein